MPHHPPPLIILGGSHPASLVQLAEAADQVTLKVTRSGWWVGKTAVENLVAEIAVAKEQITMDQMASCSEWIG